MSRIIIQDARQPEDKRIYCRVRGAKTTKNPINFMVRVGQILTTHKSGATFQAFQLPINMRAFERSAFQ